MSARIHFKGTDYDSVEAMPPHIRRAYEQSQRDKVRPQRSQADDGEEAGEEKDADAGSDEHEAQPKPAWSGALPGSGVPVPEGFESVTSLGPATAVQKYDWSGILPDFGTPRARVVVHYRDGFAYQTGGKDIHTWRWDEVAGIQSNLSRHPARYGNYYTQHQYTLTNQHGDKVILDDGLTNVPAEASAIKQAVFALMGPALVHRYQAGEALTFGPVTVQRQNGLQLEGKLFAWNAIGDIQVKAGRFLVTLSDGKTHQAPVSAIPNVEMLCQVIGAKWSPQELERGLGS